MLVDRDEWLKIWEGEEYEVLVFTWLPKQALIAVWETRQIAAEKKVVGQAVQARAIANGAKKRLNTSNDMDQLIR